MSNVSYTEDNIRSLDWKEHIRMRPGMYIGKLGDGTAPDDGIYILLKEILDNSGLKLISAENLDDAAKKIIEAIN